MLEVDKANQRIEAKQIEESKSMDIVTATEVQLVLPIIDEVRHSLDRLCIRRIL